MGPTRRTQTPAAAAAHAAAAEAIQRLQAGLQGRGSSGYPAGQISSSAFPSLVLGGFFLLWLLVWRFRREPEPERAASKNVRPRRRRHADRQQIQQRQHQRDRQDDPQGRQSASLPCRFFLRVRQLHLLAAAAQLRDGLFRGFSRALVGRQIGSTGNSSSDCAYPWCAETARSCGTATGGRARRLAAGLDEPALSWRCDRVGTVPPRTWSMYARDRLKYATIASSTSAPAARAWATCAAQARGTLAYSGAGTAATNHSSAPSAYRSGFPHRPRRAPWRPRRSSASLLAGDERDARRRHGIAPCK